MTEGKLAPYLRVANVFDGYIDFSDLNEMAFKRQEIDRFRLMKGDILLNEGQSVDLVGRCAMFTDGPEDCCYQNTLVRYRAGPKTDPHFALQLFRYCQLTGVFSKIAVKTNSIAHLGVSRFAELELPFPPYQAQVRIADILGKWDAAIQKTEQLIAAKERHYSALITRLITRRSKSWPHGSIRDIADRVQRQGDGGDYPLLTISSASGFVRQEDRYSRYMAGESAKTYTLLRAGEFSYNKGNSKRYEFGCVFQLEDYEAALVPSVYVSFTLHKFVCAAYMRHLFAADYLKPQLRALVKTGVRNNGLLNIRPDEFMGTTVPLPPLKEQAGIANVLDAASEEIDLLGQQLAALQTQKRGLMQKLLTGQWRLPTPKSTEVPTDA